MKTRLIAIAAAITLLLHSFAFASVDTRKLRTKKRLMSRLVAQLPDSDAIAFFEAKRFLTDAMPQILSANQTLLGQILTKISEIEKRTGIDLRKFESVAVGFTMREVKANEFDFDAVALANGDISATALVSLIKNSHKGTYRQEQVKGRTVLVFAAPKALNKASLQTSNSKIADTLNKVLDALNRELAVTALDNNTIVFGSLKRVHETLEAKSRPSTDLTAKLTQNASAVMSFAAKTPPGTMSKFLPLDDDNFGKNMNSIRFVSGSINVVGAGTSLQLTAQTERAEQAAALGSTLTTLQMAGGAILGGSKRADQQVYSRIIRAVQITSRTNEVTLDLLVSQADIDTLIGGIK